MSKVLEKNEKQPALSKMDSKQLTNWLETLTDNNMTKVVRSKQIVGKDLLNFSNEDEIMKTFSCSKEKAAKLFVSINRHKQTTNNGTQSLSSVIKFIDRYKMKPISKWIEEDVKSWISSLEKIESKQIQSIWNVVDKFGTTGYLLIKIKPTEVVNLFHVDKIVAEYICEEIKKLQKDDDETKETEGEEKNKLLHKQERVRVINTKLYPYIRVTTKIQDCISLEDSPHILRAVMSCQHAISASTMYVYITKTFEQNPRAVDIICPVPKCGEKWDWMLCCQIADLTKDEKHQLEAMRSLRLNDDIRTCPFCKFLQMRSKNLELKVKCGNEKCNGGFWCWYCLNPWKSDNVKLKFCGNKDCTFIKSIEKQLAECDFCVSEFKDDKNQEVKVPRMRACPTCLTLSHHIQNCKHVTCKQCNTAFCFICCEIPAKCTAWGEAYKSSCKVAKPQTFC